MVNINDGVQTICPGCGTQGYIPSLYANSVIKCTKCYQQFIPQQTNVGPSQTSQVQNQAVWYIHIDGQSVGPYQLHDIQSMLMKGQIMMGTMICTPNMQQWVQVSQVPELCAFMNPQIPLSTSPPAPRQVINHQIPRSAPPSYNASQMQAVAHGARIPITSPGPGAWIASDAVAKSLFQPFLQPYEQLRHYVYAFEYPPIWVLILPLIVYFIFKPIVAGLIVGILYFFFTKHYYIALTNMRILIAEVSANHRGKEMISLDLREIKGVRITSSYFNRYTISLPLPDGQYFIARIQKIQLFFQQHREHLHAIINYFNNSKSS